MMMRSVHIFVCLLFSLPIVGCSSLDPFAEPPVPRPGIERTVDGEPRLQDDGSTLVTTYVPAAAAREYGRLLQDEYRRLAGRRVALQRAYNFSLISLATTAIGLAAIDNARETAAILGLTAAGAGWWGQTYLTTSHKRIYLRGAMAMECVIGAAVGHTSIDKSLLELQRSLTRARAALGRYEALSGNGFADLVRSDIKVVERYIENADPLGQILLSKIESIRLQVDGAIAEEEPDIIAVDEALRDTLIAKTQIFSTSPRVSLDPPTTEEKKNAAFVERLRPNDPKRVAYLKAKAELERAHAELVEQFNQTGGVAISYPPNLFNSCAFNPGEDEILVLQPEEFTVAPGQHALLSATVSGGSPPYKLRENTIPATLKDKVKLGAVLARGAQNLTIEIPKGGFKTAGNHVIVVADGNGAGQRREIVISVTGQSGAGPNPARGGPDTNNILGKPTPDADVIRLQNFLDGHAKISGKAEFDPKKIDGFMGDDSRKATLAFLKDNYSQLTPTEKNNLKAAVGVSDEGAVTALYSRLTKSRAAGVDEKLVPFMLDTFDIP